MVDRRAVSQEHLKQRACQPRGARRRQPGKRSGRRARPRRFRARSRRRAREARRRAALGRDRRCRTPSRARGSRERARRLRRGRSSFQADDCQPQRARFPAQDSSGSTGPDASRARAAAVVLRVAVRTSCRKRRERCALIAEPFRKPRTLPDGTGRSRGLTREPPVLDFELGREQLIDAEGARDRAR